mmetsp:Transcript_1711/g.3965  ORF Transcript_1711/g.3965 Transcript_1711/m.3965 type:complete len:186 (+) Transcript_1711:40-597(+)
MADRKAGAAVAPPKLFAFPPFFTIQPVQATRKKQLEVWVEWIRDFQKSNGQTSIIISQAASKIGPPFANPDIKRKLNERGIRCVLDALCSKGYAFWEDEKKEICHTTSKTLEEWKKIILTWAKDNGQFDRMSTFNEFRTEHDDAAFHKLEPRVLHEIFKNLEKNGSATLIPGDNLDELGIKLHER